MIASTDSLLEHFILIITLILLYTIVLFVLRHIIDYIEKYSDNRFLNLAEYLPEEEVHTLRQVFFLIVITMSFTIIIYTLISLSMNTFSSYFVYVDILISIITCLIMKKETRFDKIIILALIPFASTIYAIFEEPLMQIFILIHLIGYAYVIKVYYDKFHQYTESNGLGISILLLFAIVFVSFIITPITEGVPLLDALVMVSNAFTSNGFSVLGHSTLGKLNSVFLVWGGYILSSAGTATLAAAIIARRFNKKFKEMNDNINKLQESIDQLSKEKKE